MKWEEAMEQAKAMGPDMDEDAQKKLAADIYIEENDSHWPEKLSIVISAIAIIISCIKIFSQ